MARRLFSPPKFHSRFSQQERARARDFHLYFNNFWTNIGTLRAFKEEKVFFVISIFDKLCFNICYLNENRNSRRDYAMRTRRFFSSSFVVKERGARERMSSLLMMMMIIINRSDIYRNIYAGFECHTLPGFYFVWKHFVILFKPVLFLNLLIIKIIKSFWPWLVGRKKIYHGKSG